MKNLMVLFFPQNVFGNRFNHSKTSTVFVCHLSQFFTMRGTVPPSQVTSNFFKTVSYIPAAVDIKDGRI